MSEVGDAIRAAVHMLAVLQALEVKYYVGESIASSFHGIGLAALGADIGADLRREQIQSLVNRLESVY